MAEQKQQKKKETHILVYDKDRLRLKEIAEREERNYERYV